MRYLSGRAYPRSRCWKYSSVAQLEKPNFVVQVQADFRLLQLQRIHTPHALLRTSFSQRLVQMHACALSATGAWHHTALRYLAAATTQEKEVFHGKWASVHLRQVGVSVGVSVGCIGWTVVSFGGQIGVW